MIKLMKPYLLIATLLSLPIASQAAEQLNGIASYPYGGQETFIAAVLTEQPTDNADVLLAADVAKTGEVHIVRDVGYADWVTLWQTCTAANNPKSLVEKTAPDLTAMFATIKGDLKRNDVMRATYRPNEGTSLILNDTRLGLVYPSKDIFTVLISCFVGPAAPSPEFRAAVLGGAKDPQLIQRYVAAQPSSARKQEVAGWALGDSSGKFDIDDNAEQQAASPQMTAYAQEVTKKIYLSVRYPSSAIRKKEEGTVTLQIEINRDGSVAGSEITQASPYPLLNRATRSAVLKAAPFAAFETGMGVDSAVFTIPIQFKLN